MTTADLDAIALMEDQMYYIDQRFEGFDLNQGLMAEVVEKESEALQEVAATKDLLNMRFSIRQEKLVELKEKVKKVVDDKLKPEKSQVEKLRALVQKDMAIADDLQATVVHKERKLKKLEDEKKVLAASFRGLQSTLEAGQGAHYPGQPELVELGSRVCRYISGAPYAPSDSQQLTHSSIHFWGKT